jgi:membrane fusion protein, heavy metal efflux system
VTSPVKEASLTTVTLTPEAEKRLGIATAPVERKSFSDTRTIGGEVVTPAGQSTAITAPVAGTLQAAATPPVPGGRVAQGQVLFRLLPVATSERESLVVAQQALDTATARRDAAARKAQRAEQLLTDGAGSRRQVEEARAELAVAEADAKAAEARRVLAAGTSPGASGVAIEAPQNGVVQAIHARAGQTVAASAPLLDLVQVDELWVRVPIYAGDARDVDHGAPAKVLALGEAPSADGTMARQVPAPPSANPADGSVDLFYGLTNAGRRFRPGERVAVVLTCRGSSGSLAVPKAALLHDAYGGTWVYVRQSPQVYARTRVVVTNTVGQLALLAEGPKPGATVVTDGAAELFGVEFGAGK